MCACFKTKIKRYLVDIAKAVHLVLVRLVFEVLMVVVPIAVVQRWQQPMVVVDVDCNAHQAVPHHTVDNDLIQEIVDLVVVLVEMVNQVDLAHHMESVVRLDIVELHLFNWNVYRKL